MEAYLLDWANLLVRWLHLNAGIAWIGASFYFVWLENNLDRRNPREGLSGDLWAIHGGGIYHLEKYKLAPPQMPENLHWFKWEAYSTWLSGFALLMVVYYLNPGVYLLAPGSSLSPTQAVMVGLGALIAGWIFGGGINQAITLTSFAYSLIGAVILLAIVNLFTRKSLR